MEKRGVKVSETSTIGECNEVVADEKEEVKQQEVTLNRKASLTNWWMVWRTE